jgi:threonine dehydrogenase-like Zn-dependent dehydrogenase
MAIFVAAKQGARVIAIDLNEGRLETSKSFGAEFTINPKDSDALKKIMDITQGKGLDSVVQCSPAGSAIALGLDALKHRGKLIQVGVVLNLNIDIYNKLNTKELSMIGSRNYNDHDTAEIIEFVRSHPEIKNLITHRFPLEEAEKAFEIAEKGDGIKVVIKP